MNVKKVLGYTTLFISSITFHILLFYFLTGMTLTCAMSLGCMGGSLTDLILLVVIVGYYGFAFYVATKYIKLDPTKTLISILALPFLYFLITISFSIRNTVMNNTYKAKRYKLTKEYLRTMRIGSVRTKVKETNDDIRVTAVMPIELMRDTDGITQFYRLFKTPTIAEIGTYDDIGECHGLVDGWPDPQIYSKYPDVIYEHKDNYGSPDYLSDIIKKGKYDMVFTYIFSKENCSVDQLAHITHSLSYFKKIGENEL